MLPEDRKKKASDSTNGAGNYSVPQAEHERRPLERNTSESEATEQLQNLYKLEIILNDQEISVNILTFSVVCFILSLS